MEIYFIRTKETRKIKFDGKLSELFQREKINKEAIVVVRDGEIITPDTKIFDKDKIVIMAVISGG